MSLRFLLDVVSIVGLIGLLAVTLSPLYLPRRWAVGWGLLVAPALGWVFMAVVLGATAQIEDGGPAVAGVAMLLAGLAGTWALFMAGRLLCEACRWAVCARLRRSRRLPP